MGNFFNGVWNVIKAPVVIFNFIALNWLGLVIGLALALITIFAIWIISKSQPNKVISVVLIIMLGVGGMFINNIFQPKQDDTKLPTNSEISETLDISVKENWTNTNGGFTIKQIQKVQDDSEAPAPDDNVINLNVQDYGNYVCFYFKDNAGLYQNAVFLKTDSGLVYDGMLMTTCSMADQGAILLGFYNWYTLESLEWQFDKSQVPYYDYRSYDMTNLATLSSRNVFYKTGSSFDAWWNHGNRDEAKAYVINRLATDVLPNNINTYFTKFGSIEIIGTKDNATRAINTFYNYLWEQIKGVEINGIKNIDVTSLTCYPIPTELQSQYPIPQAKQEEYGAEFYGVYKTNTYVHLTLEQGNKVVSKTSNVDDYVKDNKDTGRLDVDTVQTNSANYTQVYIDLICVDGDITNVDLATNPVTINFTCDDLGLAKSITYTTKNKLANINKILLVSDYRWNYEVISNNLVFNQNKGYFEPTLTNAKLELTYSYYDNYIIADVGLMPIQTIDESLIDLSKYPVKIILTNGNVTHQFVFDNNSMLHQSINKLVELGKYTYTILSDQLIFASVSGEIEITTTQTSFLFNYAQTIDVGNLIFTINVSTSNRLNSSYSNIKLSAPSSVVNVVRDNLSKNGNKDYYVKLYFFDKDGNIVEIKSHTHSSNGGCSDIWTTNNLIDGNEYDCQVRFVDTANENLTYISDNYHFTFDNTKVYTFNYTAKVK